ARARRGDPRGDLRRVRREHVPEGDGSQALGVPARRRRRRSARRRDACRARRSGTDPVAPGGPARRRDAASRKRLQGRDRAGTARARARRRRRMKLVVALAALVFLAGCGSSKHATTTNGCTDVSQPKPAERTASKPTARLDPAKTYDVRLQTNCGPFTIRLAVSTSPATTASFAHLVRSGFFDHTVFHRIAPGFVIQGGDPTASGTGGPGYSTRDPVPANTRYTFGLVAMAKTQTEPAGT